MRSRTTSLRSLIPFVLALGFALAGCSSEPPPAGVRASAATGSADPVHPAAPPTSAPPGAPAPAQIDEPSPAASNINKLVIGGNNKDPQMGLFALRAADAKAVFATMKQGLEPAYELALGTAVKAWAGKRNFCSDAVRQTIGYYGIDGMLDAKALASWRKASFTKLKAKHLPAILRLHDEMIGESDPVGCEDSLRTYVEALRFVATEKLELLNFGF